MRLRKVHIVEGLQNKTEYSGTNLLTRLKRYWGQQNNFGIWEGTFWLAASGSSD
jgi:hypothetical protein